MKSKSSFNMKNNSVTAESIELQHNKTDIALQYEYQDHLNAGETQKISSVKSFEDEVREMIPGGIHFQNVKILEEFQDKDFERDTKNGLLSNQKLEYEINQRHVRQVSKNAQGQNVFLKFSCCRTQTGWFGQKKKKNLEQSDALKDDDTADQFSQELGTGVSIYFKQLKLLFLMFVVFCILNIPALWIFAQGGQNKIQNFYDIKGIFSTFTLGNLGSSSQICKSINLSLPILQHQCSFGIMDSLELYVIADTKTNNCSTAFENQRKPINGISDVKPECNFTNNIQIQKYFNETCKGLQSCLFQPEQAIQTLAKLPNQCRTNGFQTFVGINCVGDDVTLVPNFLKISRKDLSIVIISFDLCVVVVFAVTTVLMQKWIDAEQYDNDIDFLQMPDFAIRVKNLPDQTEYKNVKVLRAMLTLHMQKVVKEEQQVFDRLDNKQDQSLVDQIVQIHFAKDKYVQLNTLREIQDLTTLGTNLRQQIVQTHDQRRRDKLESQVQDIKKKIQKQIDVYQKDRSQRRKGEIKNAYVVFRSMEGAARCMQAYTVKGKCQKCNISLGICCAQRFPCCLKSVCCKIKPKKHKFFNKRWLACDEAMEPSLILWENLGYSSVSRFIRQLFTILITLVVILCVVIVTVYMKKAEEDMQKFSPQVRCNPNMTVTAEQALADFNYPKAQQQGFMYCYCKDILQHKFRSGQNFLNLDQQFSDGEPHCQTWLQKSTFSRAFTFAGPMGVNLLSYLGKLLFRRLTIFQKHQSEPQKLFSSTWQMAFLTFVNMVVIMILVNFNFGVETELPIFRGTETTFSVNWYRLVGSSVCFSMAITAFTTSIIYLGFALLKVFLRCLDRRCTKDRKNTKKLTQFDYENQYLGPEWQMDYRYSNILTVINVTMFYGSGMPFLYILAAIYFFLQYWTDKLLLLNYYRKPQYFDNKLAVGTSEFLKLTVIFHFVGGIFMLSDSSILPSWSSSMLLTYQKYSKSWLIEQYNDYVTVQMLIYVAAYFLIFFIYIFWDLIISRIINCARHSQENLKKQRQQEVTEADFYKCVSFDTLKNELFDTRKLVLQAHRMIQNGDCYNKNFQEKDCAQYITILEQKAQAIKTRIYEISQQQLNFSRLTIQSCEKDADLIDSVIDKCIEQMYFAQLKGKTQNCKIKEDLQSYNVMHNLEYQKLQGLKTLLDQ